MVVATGERDLKGRHALLSLDAKDDDACQEDKATGGNSCDSPDVPKRLVPARMVGISGICNPRGAPA